ncbi:phosphate starvation-inducible protein PhoH [candidate division TA06 bacterium B3_TA06]|uniref:PhoH-like protein n=1 Tax=candidate division TA06 bacterium B3_TA06 TaxID=2012487 RepID=A0A532V0L4_UNCT6|nr:MAG: phosphate starvation-inducible protein PhoH [candidate division TA06 bacterium B3_TA06]
MSRRILKIKDVDPLLLTGVGEENLRVLRGNFDVQIVARGTKLALEGRDAEVDKVADLVGRLCRMIRAGRIITPEIVLAETEGVRKTRNRSEQEEGVIYTPRKVIRPQSEHQQRYIKSIDENSITFSIGPAGTGKTYLAVAKAVEALTNDQIDRIILTRPAVEAGESLGFLPGDLKEKVDPYLRPLYDALSDMIPAERMRRFLDNQVIEIAPLAFMRGRTLSDAYIILDEAQNTTPIQMKMFLTRLGWNSHSIITGDVTQIDLGHSEQSGLLDARKLLSEIEGVMFIYFDSTDVVRPPLVSAIIEAYEKKKPS